MMENEKNNPQEQDWFEGLTSPIPSSDEIGTDEQAMADHNMSNIADMELDKIMREAMSDEWDLTDIETELLNEPAVEEPSASSEEPVYSDEPEAEPAQTPRVERKVRPKRKNGYGLFGLPHLASTAIWVLLCVGIGISLGRLLWICAADILAFGRTEKEVVVTITANDDLDSVTDKLLDAQLIKYESLFKFYCQLAGKDVGDGISTGTFTLNTLYDYHALVSGMSSNSSYRETIEVTIPEGYTCAQIFALLEEKGVCTAADLEAYCIENEFSSYWFLENVEKGTAYCLEGFLFPDTYQFYTNSSAQQVFIKFLGRFDDIMDEEMQGYLVTLNETLTALYKKNGLSQNYIDEHQFTVKDVVTVASMIEKETYNTGESRTIASVFYNRLTNPSNYPYLQIDATVVYALGGKTDLTSEDLAVDSPYNTYVTQGLPAGPISNPGYYSLLAAMTPESTGYYFYALDTDGSGHRFFKTYSEHLDFINSKG